VGGHQYPPGSKFPKHGCIFLMGRKRSEECHMAYLLQISENDFNKKMVWVQGGCFQIVTENLMRYLVMVGMMNNEIELKWLLSATLDE
jgi:hypothetical protein